MLTNLETRISINPKMIPFWSTGYDDVGAKVLAPNLF